MGYMNINNNGDVKKHRSETGLMFSNLCLLMQTAIICFTGVQSTSQVPRARMCVYVCLCAHAPK